MEVVQNYRLEGRGSHHILSPMVSSKLVCKQKNESISSKCIDLIAGLNGQEQNKKGMVLPFTPYSITFDNIKYFVDMPAVSLTSLKVAPTMFCGIN